MLSLRRILVPTDFSESAEAALRQAELGAAKHSADVHVLHITDAQCPGVPADPDEVPPAVHAVRRADSVVDGILAYAEEHDVDLVVMGTHGRRGVRNALLGTTTERVVRLARVPVLTVRSGAAPRSAFSRILVPVDFSEASRSLIAHARHVAAAWEASLDVLYVVEDPRFPAFFRVDAHRAALPTLLLRAREALQAFAEATEGPDVPMRYHALTGDPASSIVAFAETQHADVILLATHGWTSLKWFTLGSVAEAVMRTAPCPVLSIKGYGKSLVEKAGADAQPVDTTVTRDPAPGTEPSVRPPSISPDALSTKQTKRGRYGYVP